MKINQNPILPFHFFTIASMGVLLTSCYAFRAFKYRDLQLMDHEKLPFQKISASTHPFRYFENGVDVYPNLANWLHTILANTNTAAFLVVKNDTVVYEKYFSPYNAQTLLPSFSVIKSFIGTLAGIAIEEQKIKSLYDPITMYLPELLKKDKCFANITIQNLLDMKSGIAWQEGTYNLKDDAIKMGFRPNILKYALRVKVATAPQYDDEYKSINTLLLGIILERVYAQKLVMLFQQKIWQPVGMESQATLNTDKHGMAITFAGLNATARDYAKLGTLYLKKGWLNGAQIINTNWVEASVGKDSMYQYGGYRNQWWGVEDYRYFSDSAWDLKQALAASRFSKVSVETPSDGKKYYTIITQTNRFHAEGILDQYVYVDPDKNIVIVRFGHNWTHPSYDLFKLLEDVKHWL